MAGCVWKSSGGILMFKENYTRESAKYEALITKANRPIDEYNGIYTRYENPVQIGRASCRERVLRLV